LSNGCRDQIQDNFFSLKNKRGIAFPPVNIREKPKNVHHHHHHHRHQPINAPIAGAQPFLIDYPQGERTITHCKCSRDQ
jgi:hypothetical protein